MFWFGFAFLRANTWYFKNSKEVVILGKVRTLLDFLTFILRFRVFSRLSLYMGVEEGLLKDLIQLRVKSRIRKGWGQEVLRRRQLNWRPQSTALPPEEGDF